MNQNKSYRDLKIWKEAKHLVIKIHLMTLSDIPKYEMYETGSQIRRAIKSVKSNIVEGFGRRRYKQDFIRFLVYALASNDEALDHLETLYDTGSLSNREIYADLKQQLNKLGRMLNCFIKAVEEKHLSPK